MKYSTIQGDMWDTIAFKVYGSTNAVVQLMEANPSYRHQFVFPAGVEINVPDLPEEQASDIRPPWKQVQA